MTETTETTETPAARYRRLAEHFDAVATAVPDDRWGAPTPCEGWSVADVVCHVADTEREFLDRHELPVATVADDAEPVDRWRASRDAVLAAMDDPAVADREFDGFFGPTTFAKTIDTFYAMDLVVHGWDVARGAGLRDLEALNPDDLIRARDQMAMAGDTVRSAGVFGPEVEVPADASDQDRFLAWTGRRP